MSTHDSVSRCYVCKKIAAISTRENDILVAREFPNGPCVFLKFIGKMVHEGACLDDVVKTFMEDVKNATPAKGVNENLPF